ncbi:bifunctional salicylyl-CoA 5-hydroxylase/oxidoreductase [Luteithermobacter gelatinilyticus]|uniref:bifunctional salicylyl-CoA 5-hydroxylase/oxidoreductase n=1 Tax=Luteithermobacter gelatinilyticus TaxID=2582913 RepID=UPI00110674AC|nr:bifunctional salicylyl-CoA 5-hydroxylase/oxidoreductase [Luteithermobacter gelatinilyticus]
MKIVCLGGGPSGVYLAISMKLRNPEHDITVYERNRPDDTFGWGVVFSDQTMENLRANDPVSAENMIGELIHWDYIDVHVKNEVVRSGGHGFIGIGRQRLLDILYNRARELGVKMHFQTEIELEDLEQFSDADLIVAADGLNSKVRNNNLEAFDCDIDVRPNKFVWLGTHQRFDDAFTFIFEETKHGWMWVHAYQFDKDTSTFIVECGPETYDAWGFEHMSHEESAETCRQIFEKYLGGHKLMTKSSHIRGSAWINFPRVLCHTWVKDNIVLIGDAAHTAHFSIGSGTKLGFEDAINLAEHLNSGLPVKDALKTYQDERELEALKLQSAARNSMSWFEELDRYLDFDVTQFTYSLLTRSQRVSHENLRLRDKEWLEGVEKWFSDRAFRAVGKQPPEGKAPPPMFTPYKIRDMELVNRVAVSPMSMYSAKDGLINDFHFVHYGARAIGGAGLLFTEMTDVSAEGRITPGCAGIYTDEHTQAWKRVVDFVHEHSQAKIALQLGHAGRKGSTKVGWEGYDVPLDDGNWELIAPSPIKWDDANQTPREMQKEDFDRVLNQFVEATCRAEEAGFDMVELHAGHGYLLSSFITPVSNQRTDEYGGSLENRLRFPIEVFKAMRDVWPDHKPMSVRISSTDWIGKDGITPEDAVLIAKAFVDAGADIIDVSTGQTLPVHKVNPVFGRMFQTPMSDQIRNEGHVSTMAVGNIFETDHVNSILAAGRADLVLIGRPHLMDPQWVIRSAAEQEYHGPAVQVPKQYLTAFTQLETNLKRAAEMALNA